MLCFSLAQNTVWVFVFLNRKSFLKVTEVEKKKVIVYRMNCLFFFFFPSLGDR